MKPRPHLPARLRDLGVVAALAGFALLLYAPLLFTNRVLATGDILFYFYPYRGYVAEMLAAGQLPLWNPYIFLGVPLLANPQSAVLYPLHWPLIGLPVTAQVYWSAALHTWLLGWGGAVLMRVWGHSRIAALITGLVLAGSGFFGGLIGHLNQMNGAAWLPWALAVLVWADQAGRDRRRMAAAAALLALLVALMLLAGHTQTVYINLFGLGVWVAGPVVGGAAVALVQKLRNRRNPSHVSEENSSRTEKNPLPSSPQGGKSRPFSIVNWRGGRSFTRSQFPPPGGRVREGLLWGGLPSLLWRLGVYAAGVGVGALLAAPQLLPTLELSSRGLRQGGLSYAEASSFSLKPLYLLWTLLPSYGLADLGVVFATLGYTEFVAYVGLVGLLLALWGAWRARGPAWRSGLLLAALGFFLAVGRWNPIYYLLYWAVPGFDLFRAPARWMMLYTLGMAILAGVGWEAWRLRRAGRGVWLGIVGAGLVALDLVFAARALPHTQTTAPQAVYDLRTAPAHLLTDPVRRDLHPAAAGRFLSMSSLTFDPGDMADYRRILRGDDAPQLDARGFDQLIIALKAQEIIAPNLALLWRIPSLDGFDGGVLPLGRYLDLLTLFVPADQLVSDGRLREQVQETPPTSLLALFNVQYLITDKVRDLWFEGIYYDRQIGARLGPDLPRVTVDAPQPLASTHLHLIAAAEGEIEGSDPEAPWLTVTVVGEAFDGAPLTTTLTVPARAIGPATLDASLPATGGPTVAYRDQARGRQEYRVVLDFPTIQTPNTLTLIWHTGAPSITVQAATLVDARTGMFRALLPSDRGRYRLVHSGDVKIYENLDVLPRAYLASTVIPAAEAADAVRLVADHLDSLGAGGSAVVEGVAGFSGAASPGDQAVPVSYAPEQVTVQTSSAAPALLVLADTFDPGWHATVDGEPAPLYRTNVLLRGVPVPAGDHTVRLVYRPALWRQGLVVGGVGLLLWGSLWVATWRRRPQIGRGAAHDV